MQVPARDPDVGPMPTRRAGLWGRPSGNGLASGCSHQIFCARRRRAGHAHPGARRGASLRLTVTVIKPVGADPKTDVAVIQVRADGLTELPFGISDRLVGGATERAGLKRDRTRRHAGTPALLRTGEIGTLTETAAGHRLQMMRGEPSRATIPRKSIGVPPFPCWLGPPSP